MPFVDGSPLNYPINTADPIPRRVELRAPIDNQDGFKYKLFTQWLDSSSQDLYVLVDKTRTTTTWVLIGGTGGAIETVTGDVGGSVPPDGSNNLNLLSDGNFTFTGNPATFTQTLSSTNGQVATKFIPDSGTSPVVPDSAGEVTIVGGNGITTVGGANQWTTDMESPFTGDFTFQKSTSATTISLTSEHTSDTASSNAKIDAKVAGTSGGDPFWHLSVGTTKSSAMGFDNDATNRPIKLVTDASGSTDPSSGSSMQEWDNIEQTSDFTMTGAIKAPSGTNAQRPGTPLNGMMRNNTDSNRIEFYENGVWRFLPDATSGRLVQSVNVSTASLVTGSTTIPFDNSIPQQSTEGTLLFTRAITPLDTNNILYFFFHAMASNNTVTINNSFALFQDATEDAIFAHGVRNTGLDAPFNADFVYFQTAGTASSTTFKVHFGPGTASTMAINGVTTALRYGGVAKASLTIYEVEP